MSPQRWMCVLWPAFLMACVCEVVVFALWDPGELYWRSGSADFTRQTLYAGGFFLFWLLGIGSSALTIWLAQPPADFNRQRD
ncbi:hypothetical protein [Variovorax sp. PBL-E5]|uniref:hypothetical protein n=1 Tax=Variovorax sp. PBL-E5 TaxID=434014 RepID=UPI0013170010|nr:hypothetical protein [Variovorax sp. PBL-E5]VTU22017.1 hypothetical protein E5CHR_01305 [Variovorax sp. PBL-E5]